ncbi:UbiX family flavin prenyltransferase [Ignatzschineria cameli]|uniref:Flavin prenyltransferase UbiX n=1 Tax=Ignatzschineria cameli TaxID=2182793 RepID=A0A2U2AKS5_9GAMM|nr:flavin prenyltransferase UbiX [Ignatzschineria cameli]PWD83585.1 aromatic acid decarboxylase [Ignatzschineria cameli]PWD83750.1 aromatic acid decarboxylase [Ignatzschineria cameli]PWD88568.1 aromatic acid decarboxylase [Ignatzschineria cameli]PWD90004.1 aromatic acid decarboxylase [Ignatzschineria cameli]PWD90064.1 aromatic acid decarboxylase [Ignatzschineria cameli]
MGDRYYKAPSKPYQERDRVTVALSGASGAQYGLRLIEVLVQAGYPVNVLLTQAALMVLALEMDIHLGNRGAEQKQRLMQRFAITDPDLIHLYSEKEWTAPLASGSNIAYAMVICPCSMGMLAAVASGQSNNLIERAADVMIKERRNLMLVVREAPFNQIHLENMLRLSQMNVQIMPANPGFYHRPQSVEDIIDFMVARILDQLDIPHQLMARWGER